MYSTAVASLSTGPHPKIATTLEQLGKLFYKLGQSLYLTISGRYSRTDPPEVTVTVVD